jgi:hypothetical protein
MGTKAQQMFAEEVLAPVGIGTYAFRSKAISSRSGTLKTLAGKHCRTLIQVKFPRAYLAVEGSARRFGTAGTWSRLRGSTAVRRGGRGTRIGPSLGAGNPAKAANVKATKSTGFKNLGGKGAQAEIEGKTVFLGSKLLMTENKIDPRRAWRKIRGIAGRWTDGRSSRCGRQARGFDRHCRCSKTDGGGRYQSAARTERVEVAMLIGDNQGTAERIAKSLRIDRVFADVLPGDKASKVQELQARPRRSVWSARTTLGL